MPTLLDPALVDDTLHALPGWHPEHGAISREVHLPTDLDAVLRSRVTADAAAMGHEPKLERVAGGTRFVLRTHDVDGVSELDIALASHISDLVHQLSETEPGVEAVRRDAPEVVSGPTAGQDAANVVQEQRTAQTR